MIFFVPLYTYYILCYAPYDPKFGDIRFSHSIIIFKRHPEPSCPFVISTTLRYTLSCPSGCRYACTIKPWFKIPAHRFKVRVCIPPQKKKWKQGNKRYSGRRTHRCRNRPIPTHQHDTTSNIFYRNANTTEMVVFFLFLVLLSYPARYFYDTMTLSMGKFVSFFSFCFARYLQSRGPSPSNSRRRHNHKILSCAQIRKRERRPRPVQVGASVDGGDIILPKVYARIL